MPTGCGHHADGRVKDSVVPEHPGTTSAMRAAADAAPTPIEAGLITIEASVQLRVAIFP